MTLPTIYRVKDAAEALGVTPAWMQRKAKCRAIPVRILGGQYAWTEDDLIEILNASRQGPAEASPPRPRKPRASAPPSTPPLLTARKRAA